jgi:PAT family beta-lactamase induction signal transducer AmpG
LSVSEKLVAKAKPAVFIPTLYFAEGLPYTVVMLMSGIFFKSFGADNIFIGLTSFLGLPWIFKFAWSPLVDFCATKRTWIIVAQFLLAAALTCLAAIAFACTKSLLTTAAIAILAVIAMASATQDVAIDGYYLDVLDEREKALYIGIRSAVYKIAWLFGSGALVYLAGKMSESYGLGMSWAVAFFICAVCLLVCGVFHSFCLPEPGAKVKLDKSISAAEFLTAIGTYFKQPGIAAIVFYILTFRFGDGLMITQSRLYLLDPPEKGGAGLSVADIGIVSGTVGVIFLLIAGIIGSWLISRDGLKRWLWPFCIIQNSVLILYFALAQWPDVFARVGEALLGKWEHPLLPAVYLVNSIEQFAYGLGVSAFMVFLLTTVRSQYKAAHFATASALMALGIMVPGAISGFIQHYVGYANFFLVATIAAVPGMISIFYLPIWRTPEKTSADGTEQGVTDAVSQTGQVGSESK